MIFIFKKSGFALNTGLSPNTILPFPLHQFCRKLEKTVLLSPRNFIFQALVYIYQGLKCTYQGLKYTYQALKCIYQALKYKTNRARRNISIPMCKSPLRSDADEKLNVYPRHRAREHRKVLFVEEIVDGTFQGEFRPSGGDSPF